MNLDPIASSDRRPPSTRVRLALQNQWAGLISLFLVLSGGTAYALSGSNTVFSDDIVNGEVKNRDLGANSVGTGKVIDGTLVGADIKNNSVTGADVLDSGIGLADLAANSVNSAKVVDNSLTGVDLTDDSVKSSDVDGIWGPDVVNGGLTGADMASNSIGGGHVIDGSLGHRDLHIYENTKTATIEGNAAGNGAYFVGGARASCDGEDIAIAGGARWAPLGGDRETFIVASYREGAGAWEAWGGNDTAEDIQFTTEVICLSP